MDERIRLSEELSAVEQMIADATKRAAELEKAIGVIQRLGGNTAPVDNALLATYRSIGLHTRRRATLMKMLGGLQH